MITIILLTWLAASAVFTCGFCLGAVMAKEVDRTATKDRQLGRVSR